ncbi:MAG: nuclear transport factor 2 family protein [Candidatus Eremiobacteraeota bacterium]|nr:nuclear transport factor 2 family protein [Candidatus Eremiobacteraeota bacterium]
MSKRTGLSLSVVFVCILIGFSPVRGAEIIGRGTQIRGSAGSNARLEGKSFTLPMQLSIFSASSSGKGFWIRDASSGSVVKSFWRAEDAKGVIIPAGTYQVFPNLQEGQLRAEVTVVFRYGGPSPAPSPSAGPGKAPYSVTFRKNQKVPPGIQQLFEQYGKAYVTGDAGIVREIFSPDAAVEIIDTKNKVTRKNYLQYMNSFDYAFRTYVYTSAEFYDMEVAPGGTAARIETMMRQIFSTGRVYNSQCSFLLKNEGGTWKISEARFKVLPEGR